MPDDSNGVYSLPAGTIVSTGDTILPSQHNPWANDNANAMSNRFSKDGRAPATGNWNLNNFRITNLGTPVATTDAVNKSYADSLGSVYATTSVNTAVGAADKGKWYRVTAAGVVIAPGAAATLGANHFFRVKNDSSGFILIDPSNGGETINGIAALIVPAGEEVFVICTGATFFATVYADPQQGSQLQGYFNGLVLSINASDAANDIDIGAGSAASDIYPFYLMQLASALTKRIDANWSAGNNQGGLDTGSVTNATYYIWLIQRSDTGVVDALFSLSSTAPTMPSNYDRKRLIGSLTRAAATNTAVITARGAAINISSAVTASGSAIDIGGIPAGVKRINFDLVGLSTNGTALINLQLGTASGIETTGYLGSVGEGTAVSFSTAFTLTRANAATAVYQGGGSLRISGANIWAITGGTGRSDTAQPFQGFGGSKSLSGIIDRMRFSTSNGTDVFDSGTITISWEF